MTLNRGKLAGAAIAALIVGAAAPAAAQTVTVIPNATINEGVSTDLFDIAQGTTIVTTSGIDTGIGGYGGASSNGVAYNAISPNPFPAGEYNGGEETPHVIFPDGSNATQSITLETAAPVTIGGVDISLGDDSVIPNDVDRGFQSVSLFGSSDGVNFKNLFTYDLAAGGYTANYGSRFITLDATFDNFTGQYFRFDGTPLSTSTTSINGGRLIEIDAVAGTADVPGAVPEPASWAMLIAGFGLVGFALRQRARTVVRYA